MAVKTITLDENEIVLLEEIIMDEDKDEAFKFIKRRIYDKLKIKDQSHLKSPV